MTDKRLHELLDDAARTYRVPPEPDFDAIWSGVEQEAFTDHPRWRRLLSQAPSWRVLTLAMAASLVLGVALGRNITRPPDGGAAVVATGDPTARSLPAEYDRTATELLGETAMLLTALPRDGGDGQTDNRFASQASELLTTTRLLLDSPVASDRRFKELLEDLELILAQVARLKHGRGSEEMDLITDALEERDVVPRIRSAVARFSLGAD